MNTESVRIDVDDAAIEGDLTGGDVSSVVVFAHGSGSSRRSTRNRAVASGLWDRGFATLLMDLVRRNAPNADVAAFRFKAVRPTFDLDPFRVSGEPQADGKTLKLWAQDHEGWLTMDAIATLR